MHSWVMHMYIRLLPFWIRRALESIAGFAKALSIVCSACNTTLAPELVVRPRHQPRSLGAAALDSACGFRAPTQKPLRIFAGIFGYPLLFEHINNISYSRAGIRPLTPS